MSTLAAATAVRETAPGRYAVDIDPHWSVGPAPHGGYMLALVVRAALAAAGHPHPLAASVVFLRRAAPGPAEVAVRPLRFGRGVTALAVTLTQDGEPALECLVSATQLAAVAGEGESGSGQPDHLSADPRTLPPRAECVRIPNVSATGVPMPLMEQIDLRLDPADLGFARHRPTGRMTMQGWFDLPGQTPDVLALLVALDALPPTAFQVGRLRWAPTVQMMASVRRLPAAGPLAVRHRTTLLDGGWFDEDAEVWDSQGRLVAQSRQLAGSRPPPTEDR